MAVPCLPAGIALRHGRRLAVSEALQVLEHAELIRLDKPWSAPNYWSATRLGWEAIENGDAQQVIYDR